MLRALSAVAAGKVAMCEKVSRHLWEPKKTSREMKQNAFRFHAQASVIMALVQYNLQSNYGFQPLNRTSLLCTGTVKK